MKRKEFLQSSAILGMGTVLGDLSPLGDKKKKSIRFGYFTDMHIKPGKEIEASVARAFHHAQQQKLEFLFNGGDAVFDALEADHQKTQQQFQLVGSLLKNENSLPVYHVIGNHDVWGWFIKENNPSDHQDYGKSWVLKEFNLKNRFYSFSKGKWHFIVLDSTQLNPAGGYIGKLDDEQYAWLQQELKNTPPDKFICLVSHIPILSICAGLFFNKTEPNGDLKIQRNLMHTDFLNIKKLFLEYPNIKVCLSGHIHLQDEVHYLGINYYCNGAVSGSWWKGSFQEFAPAYAIIELYEDGTSHRTMVNY